MNNEGKYFDNFEQHIINNIDLYNKLIVNNIDLYNKRIVSKIGILETPNASMIIDAIIAYAHCITDTRELLDTINYLIMENRRLETEIEKLKEDK